MTADASRRYLSEHQLERIRDDALAVLETVGIEIGRADALQRLAVHPGVRVRGNRALLSQELVAAGLAGLQRLPPSPPRNSSLRAEPLERRILVCVYLSTHPVWAIDPSTGQRVGPDAELYAKMVQFADSMHEEGVRWGGGYTVEGLPAPWSIKAMAATRLDMLLSRDGTTLGKEISPPELLHLCMDMHDVVGKPAYHSLWAVSPLRLVGDEFDAAVALIGRPNAYFHVSTWSMAGLSSPMPVRAACVETIATGLGCYLVMDLLAPGQVTAVDYEVFPALPVELGSNADPAPTPILSLWEAKQEIAAYFGGRRTRVAPNAGPELRSGGISPDGAFCFAQLLADRERADKEEAEARGRDQVPDLFDDPSSSVDMLREGVEQGGVFTGLESTVRSWRSLYWFGRGCARLGPGDPRLLDEIRRRIGRHSWRLQGEKAGELDRIYRAACERFGQGYRPGPVA